MPLAPLKGFLGPSYQLSSVNASLQRTLNLVPEIIESGNEKVVGFFKGSPGLSAPFFNLAPGPIRGLLAAGSPLFGPERMFAVADNLLYELFADGHFTALGDVGNDGKPVQMFPSGDQLGVVSKGQFWISSGGAPAPVDFTGTLYSDIAVGWAGTCTATAGGITIVRNTGPAWNKGMQGLPIIIGGNFYTVDIVFNADNLVCTGAVSGLGVQAYDIAATDTGIQSARNPFTSADVGSILTFTAFNGFRAGPVTVVLVDAYGNAAVDVAPNGVGGEGGMGGVATQTVGPVLAGTGAYLDSVFIVAPRASKKLYVSAPLNGGSWDGADVATKESYPDNIGAILADHEELYVMGEVRSEVWRAPGADPNFPFQRDPGACMSVGIAAPATLCGFLDGVVWIGASLRGKPVAYFAKGYQPERISTHAIEQAWAGYATVADATAFTYSMDGHELWQISFPTGDAAWVWDKTASLQFGKAMWHERNSWDGAAFHRHRASCHAFVWGKHWVGDFATGAIYEMSATQYEDTPGRPITCVRTLPHLSEQRLREFFTKLQIDVETGGGVNGELTITVQWSDDGGKTFVGGGPLFTHVCSTTDRLERVTFWQMGSSQTGDRVYRLTFVGACRKAIMQAYLDSFAGTT